jgi:ornithine carbamoyltransferase
VSVRHFIADDDISPGEQHEILALARRMKADRFGYRSLEGPLTGAVLFDKPSTRTRVSFAAGIADLGGSPILLDTGSMQFVRGETIEDTTRVLERYCALIAWRTFGQDRLERMAAISRVPVINALSDLLHPCQVLADLFTIEERLGSLRGLVLTYVGDAGNNIAHSYLLAGATAGMHVRLAGPDGYAASPLIVKRATEIARATQGSVTMGRDPHALADGAAVLATDTWISMGQEEDAPARMRTFGAYRLDSQLLSCARPDAIVLHCLPANRGMEITDEVLDGPQSAVWDEAENRRHVQKALMHWLLSMSTLEQ